MQTATAHALAALLLFLLSSYARSQACEETPGAGEREIKVCNLEVEIKVRKTCTVDFVEKYTLPPSSGKTFVRVVPAFNGLGNNITRYSVSINNGDAIDDVAPPGKGDNVRFEFKTGDFNTNFTVEIKYTFNGVGAVRIRDHFLYYRRHLSYVFWRLDDSSIQNVTRMQLKASYTGLNATIGLQGVKSTERPDENGNPSSYTGWLRNVETPYDAYVEILNGNISDGGQMCEYLRMNGEGTPIWADILIAVISVLAIIAWLLCVYGTSSSSAPPTELVPLTAPNLRRRPPPTTTPLQNRISEPPPDLKRRSSTPRPLPPGEVI